MHVLLVFEHTKTISKQDFFHISLKDPSTNEMCVLRGGYESAKNRYSVMRYLLKTPDVSPLTNMFLLDHNGVLHDTPESYLCSIAYQSGMDAAVSELLDKFPKLAVRSIIPLKSKFKAFREAYHRKESNKEIVCKEYNSFQNVPPEVDL